MFKKFAGKTLILPCDITGFLDTFFVFVINGALVAGKIAAISIISKQKALQEFKKYTSHVNKDLILHIIYWHLPLKNFIRLNVVI